ncbi:spo12 family domain-containing protein [Trichoderma breve]|uniref:Spo12 family domain-containing protein n=1 Tax=Trichoderma breve TaxID=2034170 RepID=A0A9W9EBY5_9HYPO|nr:spo12 family domain-containing protein [Trichoderma breve]KAJ4863885.1 spo12 family domain-containing protein [Trichoderma breve]
MSSNKILGDRDVNAALADGQPLGKDVKSMEYHRQVFQSRMAQDGVKQYVSPSDTIMSPCTAKLSALRSKQVTKAKPKSLFAQASSKKLNNDENLIGTRPAQLDNPLGARSVKTTERTLTSRLR